MRLLFLIFCLTALHTRAQTIKPSDLNGRWHMLRMYHDNTCVLDVNDSTYILRETARIMGGRETSEADSLVMVKQALAHNRAMVNAFLQFNADGRYEMSRTMDGTRFAVNDTELGTYQLYNETEDVQVIVLDRTKKMEAKLRQGILKLQYMVGEKQVAFEYTK